MNQQQQEQTENHIHSINALYSRLTMDDKEYPQFSNNQGYQQATSLQNARTNQISMENLSNYSHVLRGAPLGASREDLTLQQQLKTNSSDSSNNQNL